MSRRTALREFQLAVNEKLRTAATRTTVSSKLGFQVGDENWFVALHQVSEVIPVPPTVVVPRTQRWFRGVANVRGNLYGIVDFLAYQGRDPIGAGSERRVILVSDKLLGGSGLLVSRMLGLRSPDQFTAVERAADAPAWLGGIYTDAAGARWNELDLPALALEKGFLEVGN
jgi:twitching motility protein PilI